MKSLPHYIQEKGLYYGWIILVVGTVGVIMSVPGQTMGVSVFTESLLKSFAIERLDLSIAYMIGTLASSLLLPYAGRLLDRVGARILGVVAALGLAFSLMFLSAAPQITRKLSELLNINPRWTAFFVLFLAFLGIRHFGQGQLTMISRTMIGRWFGKRRGLIMGISGLFVAFGFGVAPLVLSDLIKSFQWQFSLQVLFVALIFMALVALIFFRQSPESCGLKLDGGFSNISDESHAEHELNQEQSFTLEEAKRTAAFWIFNFGTMAQAMLVTAITFHIARIGLLNNLSPAESFSLFLPLAFVSTSADLIGGILSDRIQMKYLLMVMQAGLAVGLLGLNFFGVTAGFWITAIGLGISSGLFSLLVGAAWPRLFGRKFLGSISGYNMAWIVSGSALGPVLFGISEQFTGNFTWSIYACAVLPIGILISAKWADQPEKSIKNNHLD